MKHQQASVWIGECADKREVLAVDRYALGARMREFRLRCGVSLRSAATAVGISAPYLSDCERGFRQLNSTRLQAFIDHCERKGLNDLGNRI